VIRELAASFLGLRAASPENPSTSLANPARWLIDWASGGRAAAGVSVNEEKALGVPIAYACCRLIADSLESLPIHVFKAKGKFAEPAPEHWAQKLLSEQPNELSTSFTWIQLIAVHALFWGNHGSEIFLDPDGTLTLLPHLPSNLHRPRLTSDGRRKVYPVVLSDGTWKEVREDRMLHIPALTTDGIWGISPVRKLRNMYGLAMATEDFGSRFFANDARPGVILETPKSMSPEASKNLTNDLYKKYTGAENRWKVLVLEEGAKMHTVQMPLEDAQFLQTRQLQDALICAEFGVPPHMVGLTEKVSSWGTGVEQMSIGFAKYTLTPWCKRIEAELNRKFFRGTPFFAKFNLEGLQRGDYKTRMEGNQIAIQSGQLLIDEVRAQDDLAPLPNGLGQIPIIPANMQTLENATRAPEKQPAGAAATGQP
jgi:HK97 family phage portal protein